MAMTTAEFESLIQEVKKRLGLTKFFAKLGDADDLSTAIVDEPGRKGYVRVRLQNDDVPYRVVKSGLLGAYPPYAGSAVILGYDEKGKLAIEKADHDGIIEADGNPLILNSGDNRMSSFTQTDGLLPLFSGAVSDTQGTLTNEIFINPWRFVDANVIRNYVGSLIDLSSLVPGANLHRYIAVFLKMDDLTIEIGSSTPIATITPLQDTDKQECFTGRSTKTIPMWLWKLSNSQTVVTNRDRIEDLRPWMSPTDLSSGVLNVDGILFNTAPTGIPDVEGMFAYNPVRRTWDGNVGNEVVLQMNQETVIPFYNDTGGQLTDPTIMRPVGGFDVGSDRFPTFEKATSDKFENCEGTLTMVTETIANATTGMSVRFGLINDVDTTGTPYSETWADGEDLYVDPTTPGALTNVKPCFPNFSIKIGGVVKAHATEGIIAMTQTTDIFDILRNFWNGTMMESFDLRITSNGTIVTATLDPTDGHPDLTAFFSDAGFYRIDTSPALTIALTPGANDETPQRNYVYIPRSTKVLTLATSGWPTTFEHIRIAEILLVTAATTQLEGGARRNQNWNDEVANTTSSQGHQSHIGEWIRAQPASYVRNTGTAATLTGTTADVYIASAPGDVMQFHRATMPPQDMTQYTIDAVSTGSKTFTISDDGDLTTTFYDDKIIHIHDSTGNDGHYHVASTNYSAPDFVITVAETIPSAVADGTIGDFIIVINDSVTALYKAINLNYLTIDSEGATLNNRWFNIVTVGVRNKSNEPSFLMCNLPSGSYSSEANAIADALNYSNYTIPDDYNGVGFLIARFTLRKSSSNFTYNGGTAYVDLRGQFPSTAAGGGGGGAGGGTMSSLVLDGDAGTPETLTDGDTISILGGTNVTTTVSATDTVTVDVPDMGMYTFVEEKVLSAATTTTFSTGISGFKRFQFKYELYGAGSIQLSIRVNGDLGETDYSSQQSVANGASNAATRTNNSSRFAYIQSGRSSSGTLGCALASNGSGSYWFTALAQTPLNISSDGIQTQTRSVQKNAVVSDITQVEILVDTSNVTGSIRLYVEEAS